MNKVPIIGCPGSGKSTFPRARLHVFLSHREADDFLSSLAKSKPRVERVV